jgi:hypothetical protein
MPIFALCWLAGTIVQFDINDYTTYMVAHYSFLLLNAILGIVICVHTIFFNQEVRVFVC